MPTLYKVPIEEQVETIPVFTMVEALDRHPSLIVEAGDGYANVTGTMETLAKFFHYLDGPAQSFPIDEFKEWASQYKVVESGNPV